MLLMCAPLYADYRIDEHHLFSDDISEIGSYRQLAFNRLSYSYIELISIYVTQHLCDATVEQYFFSHSFFALQTNSALLTLLSKRTLRF